MMENKKLENKTNYINHDDEFVSLDKTNYNHILTNDQKLECLSKLIYNADQNMPKNGVGKKITKNNNKY